MINNWFQYAITPFKLYRNYHRENKIKGKKQWEHGDKLSLLEWASGVGTFGSNERYHKVRKWPGFFQHVFPLFFLLKKKEWGSANKKGKNHVERKIIKSSRFSYAAEGGEAAEHIGTPRVGQWPGWHRKASLLFTYSRFMCDMQCVYSMQWASAVW